MSDKETVLEAVRGLSDGATIEEICEEIEILAAIRRAEREADAGHVISHEEAKKRAASWATK